MSKANKTKQQIVEKSWELIGKNSFFSASMQDIASFLDIRKSLLYYYFENKSILFQEVIKNYFKKLERQFQIILDQNISSTQKINKLTEIYLQEITDKNLVSILSNKEKKLDKSVTKVMKNIQDNIYAYFEKIIKDGIDRGEIRNTNTETLCVMILGYIEKIKQYNLKPDKNWLNFLLK